MPITYRPTIEALSDAAYHAENLLKHLNQINPDAADEIVDRQHRATARALAVTLDLIAEHPAVAFLP